MKIAGVILAAGNGSRMRSTQKKQFMNLHGMPIIAHSLLTFQKCDLIDGITIVTQLEDFDRVLAISKKFDISKLDSIVEGSKNRSDSSLNGVVKAAKYDIVAIHDAARPFLSQNDLYNVINSTIQTKASILGCPINDTVALIETTENGQKFFSQVLDRTKLFRIQTPQVFDRKLILEALQYISGNNIVVTDDASAVREIGHSIYIVEGSESNIKITSMQDLNN